MFIMLTDLPFELYSSGARNFLFFNVPAVDRVPQGDYLITLHLGDRKVAQQVSLTAGSRPRLAQYIAKFNAAMQTMVRILQQLYPSANVWLFDTNTLFNRVLDDPSTYRLSSQIRNTTAACGPYAQ